VNIIKKAAPVPRWGNLGCNFFSYTVLVKIIVKSYELKIYVLVMAVAQCSIDYKTMKGAPQEKINSSNAVDSIKRKCIIKG
jgi:hypothetical protein